MFKNSNSIFWICTIFFCHLAGQVHSRVKYLKSFFFSVVSFLFEVYLREFQASKLLTRRTRLLGAGRLPINRIDFEFYLFSFQPTTPVPPGAQTTDKGLSSHPCPGHFFPAGSRSGPNLLISASMSQCQHILLFIFRFPWGFEVRMCWVGLWSIWQSSTFIWFLPPPAGPP